MSVVVPGSAVAFQARGAWASQAPGPPKLAELSVDWGRLGAAVASATIWILAPSAVSCHEIQLPKHAPRRTKIPRSTVQGGSEDSQVASKSFLLRPSAHVSSNPARQ